MSATSINARKFRIDSGGNNNVLLTARSDLRIVKLGFLAAALIAAVAGSIYVSPISDGVKVAFLPLIGLFVVALVYSMIMYETLANAVFKVTNEHIEEEGGFIWKTQHRIPLSYVRDVTYDQNFLQAMFGVSSVAVTPTNGNKIVLSNIRDGERTREVIWNLVLSRSPGKKRTT
jgi:membrane protein YdbS with pleckstrin-like domain